MPFAQSSTVRGNLYIHILHTHSLISHVSDRRIHTRDSEKLTPRMQFAVTLPARAAIYFLINTRTSAPVRDAFFALRGQVQGRCCISVGTCLYKRERLK